MKKVARVQKNNYKKRKSAQVQLKVAQVLSKVAPDWKKSHKFDEKLREFKEMNYKKRKTTQVQLKVAQVLGKVAPD